MEVFSCKYKGSCALTLLQQTLLGHARFTLRACSIFHASLTRVRMSTGSCILIRIALNEGQGQREYIKL